MGWTHTEGATRADVINYLTRDGIFGEGAKCLKKATRGNVLWAVIEVKPDDRFILCALLSCEKGFGWGYKDMTESMHPYYYSCPVSFLEMVPVACQPWRDGVLAAAAKARRKFKVGVWYTLPGRRPNKVRIESVSPLRGRGEDGLLYRVSSKFLGEEIPVEV
jgi:hypothetical protein